MNKHKLVTYRGEDIMEDDYKVTVYMESTTEGSKDEQFPDNTVTIEFNATDTHMDVVLSKFQDLLNAMGYVTEGSHLELVSDDA